MSAPQSHYDILGISPDATQREIVKRYRKLCKKHHPDLNPGNEEEATEKFKTILGSFEVLRDEKLRAEYDESLKNNISGSGFNFKRSTNRPEATFKKTFDFIIGDRVRFRNGVSQFYYGETGYDKRDVATVSGIQNKKIIIDYPFCPGVYALPEELELAGPSEWIVLKKVCVNESVESREINDCILRKGNKITAIDMEGDRIFINKAEYKGKSVTVRGWVSIESLDGNVKLLKRDTTQNMDMVGCKTKAVTCFECKNGHELVETRSGGNHRCDMCKILSGHTWSCYECDYDVCYVCRCDAKWNFSSDENIDSESLYAHLNNTNAIN